MKNFKGKAIYNPSGKAGEYAEWACNFYVGCSNGCTYCYCKKGILAGTMGQDEPQLKKFRDTAHAMEVFRKELAQNLPELQKHGLFFSFTTDPLLPKTMSLTFIAVGIANSMGVPVKILTKRADMALWGFTGTGLIARDMQRNKHLIAIGLTLTGHDEREPNASPNAARIEAIPILRNAGFKTFASIEPVIDFGSSKRVIAACDDCCDLFKIGLLSGGKYKKSELREFVRWVVENQARNGNAKIYFKDSLLKQAGIDRATLPENCVGRDFNLFR